MHAKDHFVAPTATEKLLQGNGRTPHPEKHTEHLGHTEEKATIPWKDAVAITISLICFTLAAISVLLPPVAAWLGQTRQLIVVGFLIAIIGYCTQIQVRNLSFLIEARFGSSTLQNYQALLVNDAWARNTTLMPQIVLLALFALPLGLSAGYKVFVGGSTSIPTTSTAGQFGLTAEPGKQLIGDGLSLLSNIYLPFWLQPTFPGTYGFNMFVDSNTTTALLDGPMPEYVRQVQSTIAEGDSLTLFARVNATVAELSPLSAEQRASSDFWNETSISYQGRMYTSDLQAGGFSGMLAGAGTTWAPGWFANHSQIFTGLWNTTNNETFESTAQRYNITRRLCTGMWNITSSTILLQNAGDLQESSEALTSVDQTLVRVNPLAINDFFGSFLAEYDWHNWKGYTTEISHNYSANMGTGLAAAMIWARQVSFSGWERQAFDTTFESVNHYEKSHREIITQRNVATLDRGAGLLVILAVHPLLTILAILGKRMLYFVPIGEGFGIVSMLGGMRGEDLAAVRGSGLSGKLSRQVKLHFSVEHDHTIDPPDRIVLGLDQGGCIGKIRKKVKYG